MSSPPNGIRESLDATARLAATLDAFAELNALTPTPLPELTIYAMTLPSHRRYLVYEPSLCVVARGAKTATVRGDAHRYDPTRCFCTALPVPAALDVRYESGPPLVGLIFELRPDELARMALELEDAGADVGDRTAASDLTFVTPLTVGLVESLDRLVRTAYDDTRRRVLRAEVVREVLFELLRGPGGRRLAVMLRDNADAVPMITIARHLQRHADQPVSVPALAREAGMSESTFYARFRSVIGDSPVQYVKSIRLTRARAMLMTGARVTEAAFAVGYSSGSQFSRDFRRAFGCAPSAVGGDTGAGTDG